MKEWFYFNLVIRRQIRNVLGRQVKVTRVASYSYEIKWPSGNLGEFHWDKDLHAWSTPIDSNHVFNTLPGVLNRIRSNSSETPSSQSESQEAQS